MIQLLFLLGWILFGIVGAGIGVADLRHITADVWKSDPADALRRCKKQYPSELTWCLVFGLMLGPVAFLSFFIVSRGGEHGWTLLPPKE